jgi:hypothetical protein
VHVKGVIHFERESFRFLSRCDKKCFPLGVKFKDDREFSVEKCIEQKVHLKRVSVLEAPKMQVLQQQQQVSATD